MLHYALYPNELTVDDPNDQIAKPVDVIVRRMEDLVKKVSGPGSILKPTEIKAVVEAYWLAIRDYLREGEAYSDDYLSVKFAIGGVFDHEDDLYDDERHTLFVVPKLKETVSGILDEVSLKKVDSKKSLPLVEQVYDWGSDSRDSKLTPGDVLEVQGQLLKMQHNLPEEGVYFVNVADGSETKVDMLRKNEPRTLTLKVPALAAGSYQLEIRNSRHDGKTLRTGVFAPILIVE